MRRSYRTTDDKYRNGRGQDARQFVGSSQQVVRCRWGAELSAGVPLPNGSKSCPRLFDGPLRSYMDPRPYIAGFSLFRLRSFRIVLRVFCLTIIIIIIFVTINTDATNLYK